MIISLARHTASEPDPQHERPREDRLPERRPGGTHNRHVDDRTPEQRTLGALLARDVARGDAIAAAAGRTAPRTVAQMRARRAPSSA